MKKLFLSMGCLLLCLPLAGCSTTSDANVLTTLNNQLDRVESVVSSTSSTEVNAVSPYTINLEKGNLVSMYKAEAYANMTNEEEIRQEVLSLNAKLKNSNAKYKLGKRKAVALNSLSSNLSKYLNYLNNTKPEVKNNVAKITKSTTPNSYNEELTKSSYVALSNLMNERYVYLDNIYCSLSQIEELLASSTVSQTDSSDKNLTSSNESTSTKEGAKNSTDSETNENCKNNDCSGSSTQKSTSNSRFLQPNIDTFNNYRRPQPRTGEKEQKEVANNNNDSNNSNRTDNKTSTQQNDDATKNQNNKTSNIDTMQSSNLPQSVTTLPNSDVNNPVVTTPNNNFPYGTMPYNTPYGYNGGYGYNGYNAYNGYGYGYNYRFNRINPGRNTDTFYPYMRNIDTYRFPPNVNGQGINGYGINSTVVNGEIAPSAQTETKGTEDTTMKIESSRNDTGKQEQTSTNVQTPASQTTSNKKSQTEQDNTNNALNEKDFKLDREITLYPRRPHLKEVRFDQGEDAPFENATFPDKKIKDIKTDKNILVENTKQKHISNENEVSLNQTKLQSEVIKNQNKDNVKSPSKQDNNDDNIITHSSIAKADKSNLSMTYKNNENDNEEKRHVI